MNRPGAGPQPLRGLPGFSGQQGAQARSAGLNPGRLQNGKLGNASGWGFMGGAPGLQNQQSRPSSAAMTSFAQTISGSQPATPLDLSEFPSLSSAPTQNPQSSSQSSWANATQRNPSQTPIQRSQQQQQQQSGGLSQGQHQGQNQQQSQQHQENVFAGASQFAGLEDYRFGAQDAIGQMSGSSQPKPGSIDDFPPLGRTGNGEVGQERRSSLMQNAGFGGQSSAGSGIFGLGPGQSQNMPIRSGILGSIAGNADGNRNAASNGGVMSPAHLGSGALSASRSPIDSMRQGQGGQGEQDRTSLPRPGQNGSSTPSLYSGSQAAQSHGISQQPAQSLPYPLQQTQRQTQQPSQPFGGDFVQSPQTAQPPDPLSSMNEVDKFGLSGLLHMIRNEGSDIASLAIGQDLTALGLDLNQPDNSPLYPTFASPFAEAGSRLAEPEFAVPGCYTVQNIQTLLSKVPAFSDETLFYIFYTMTRDVMQDVVAAELANRSWRYHKELKQWLTKDSSYEPQRINAGEERGFYIFFDTNTWQRQRREFLLHYDSLDSRAVQLAQGTAGASINQGLQ